MTANASQLAQRTAELRSAFDCAFASPVHPDTTVKQDLLAIRVGPEPCAIRLSEIVGLFVDRRITRVPTDETALVGIAGFRGAILPVYSLSTLLGHPQTQAPRWLVVSANTPIALAFDLFEGHLRVAADAVLPRQSDADMARHAREFFRSADVVRPVLHLASIIEGLRASAASAAAS
jgi:chemotaxis signal transduction protein